MSQDFILNGAAHGSACSRLLESGMDLDALRPFVAADGNTYVTERRIDNNGQVKYGLRLVTNAPATLRKDEWQYLDRTVREVARAELGAYSDLLSRNLRMNIPGGLGVTVLQHQSQSDIGAATISMDGLRRGENDRVLYDLTNLPLPLIHKDLTYSMRDVMVSRQMGTGLDTTSIRIATRKVLEEAEKLVIGTTVYPSYGGGTIYGYTTYPDRLTQTITAPTTGGWTPETLLTEMLTGRQSLVDNYQRGPIAVYMGTAWMKYLDADYSAAKGDNTLRDRIRRIESIESIRTLDYLSGFQIIMAVMREENVRLVRYAPLRVVRWEEQGGFELKFKVMLGATPQFRSDYNGKIGLLHMNV